MNKEWLVYQGEKRLGEKILSQKGLDIWKRLWDN